MKRNSVIAFEQNCLRTMRTLEARPQKLLLACSGGVDSMVLLEVLYRLRNLLRLELIVAHVHHGTGNARFRTKAWKVVRAAARKKGLEFVSNSPAGKSKMRKRLSSEAELRDYRWHHLRAWKKQLGVDAIVVGHHFHDLLETRMMRLIRGTGVVGFTSMSVMNRREGILRPLLMVEKARVSEYAKAKSITFVEDPSNEKADVMRNWMRRWLKQLDQRQPNGARNLARSLAELVEQLEATGSSSHSDNFSAVLTDGGIDRRKYLGDLRTHQKTNLARYCHQMGIKNYTQGHIEELVKRLDAREKRFTFEMLQCVWSVTPERIKASRPP